jgi:glycosidase
MRRAVGAVGTLLLFLACGGFAACGGGATPASGPGVPVRQCGVTVWHKPASSASRVEIVGDFNDWKRPGRVLPADRDDGWRGTFLELSPGEHTYAIVEDGTWIVDPRVPTSAFHDGREVTWVEVPECERPELRVESGSATPEGRASVNVTFVAGRSGDALDMASVRVVDRAGVPVDARVEADGRGRIATFAEHLAPGKHTWTISATDVHGRPADPAIATIWVEPRPIDVRDLSIYQIIVDRFRDERGALAPPAIASDRAGGNLDGVRAAIESGEIASLGFNAIWLSPLYANPEGTFPGTDGRPYSSYHGYWPIAARALDPRVATEDKLDLLVAAAHARGIRVLFDVVPNHVHEQHPYVREHAAWINRAANGCVCGTASCDWAGHIQDCWFSPYMPDLDWKNPEAARVLSDDVRWWFDRFDADGVRIDAVPMMPRAATRRIAWSIRSRYDHPGHKSLLLGENFTGPGGYSILRYQLGPHGLDSEFNFPLMWALRSTLAEARAPLTDLDGAIRTSEAAWEGSGAVMGLMIGNHDVPRFASVANGDADGDGWTPAQTPRDALVYAKQSMALAVIFALPGAPVVYYGDEIALPGRNDPDSRRVMPAEASLSDLQRGVREVVRKAAHARACSDALRRGTYRTLLAEPERLVFAREIPGAEPVVVVVSRQPPAEFAGPIAAIPAGSFVDALSGRETSLNPELTKLARAPFSVQLLLPATSPCLPRPR